VLTGPGALGLVSSLLLAAAPDAARRRGGLPVLLLRAGLGIGTLCALLWGLLLWMMATTHRMEIALLWIGAPLALALTSSALHALDTRRAERERPRDDWR
ncbi:MAG TPA: hypothetical protein VJP77_00030, partial [Planctomycetota bacterium]|nr:hypothetical protein [Planctomycetota bacterium]